jgi:hypothetical protein
MDSKNTNLVPIGKKFVEKTVKKIGKQLTPQKLKRKCANAGKQIHPI